MNIDPTTLKLKIYPAKVLRKKCAPVPAFDQNLKDVAAAMVKIMRESDGVGLAAPQVGVEFRIFVADVPPNKERSTTSDPVTATDGPVVYVNPVITLPPGPVEADEEGCLSLPDVRGDVLRPPTVTISAFDVDGKPFTLTGTGLLARCWQHELDHLNGVLIIDKMTQMSRIKNRAAIRDLEADA